MDKEYNRWKNGITRFGAIRKMNSKSGFFKYEEVWYNEEYAKDLYSFYS